MTPTKGTSSPATAGTGLEPTRAPLNRARHAPGYLYASAEVYELEREKIFTKDWLCVGREEEWDRPGDYRSFRIMGEPVVVTRDREGQLNAFANVCVHRGVEVASGEGNVREFSCPYHGWVYDLRGKLLGAPLMREPEGFDLKSCRLAPVRIGTWAGFVFVCLDGQTPPLEEFLADFVADFAFLRPEECRLSGKVAVEFDCNWKLIVENVLDMYHVGVLHGRSFGAHTSFDPDKFKLKPNGGIRIDYASAPAVPGGKSLFGTLPWLADQPESFAVMGYLPPNLHLVARSDQIRVLVTWPLAPDRCRIVLHSLFPKQHFSLPHFEAKARLYHDFLENVLAEDQMMVQSLQHAMTTREYRPGPMSTLEKAVHHCVNNVLRRLYGDG